jgi:hypothetical protein
LLLIQNGSFGLGTTMILAAAFLHYFTQDDAALSGRLFVHPSSVPVFHSFCLCSSIRCLTVCACACISCVPRSLSLSLSVCVRLRVSAVWQACFAGAIFKSGAYVFFVGVALQYSETYSRCSYIRFARETLMNPASLFPRARRVLRLVDGIPRLRPPSSFLLPPSSEGRVCLRVT